MYSFDYAWSLFFYLHFVIHIVRNILKKEYFKAVISPERQENSDFRWKHSWNARFKAEQSSRHTCMSVSVRRLHRRPQSFSSAGFQTGIITPPENQQGTPAWRGRGNPAFVIIGKEGKKLKGVGKAARVEIEALLGTKVMLELWVKIKENWRESNAALSNFGYTNKDWQTGEEAKTWKNSFAQYFV